MPQVKKTTTFPPRKLFAGKGILLLLFFFPSLAFASFGKPLNLHMVDSGLGLGALLIFILAYTVVMIEEFTHLRKSKPVVLAAGFIWILVALACQQKGMPHAAEIAVMGNLLEYAQLFLFLLVAMTFVNAMEERNVFETLRAWLVKKGFSYRQLFWITGILAFFISPIADNLTTALLMCAVVMAIGADNPRFVGLACINIVVSANAGGAFSPFGDITTLMVWQAGFVKFQDFFFIFVPSVVGYIVPAVIMHFAIPKVTPEALLEDIRLKYGAKRVVCLFLTTITITVGLHNFLALPPVIGMMTGLALLKFFGYHLKRHEEKTLMHQENHATNIVVFDIFRKVERAEWDTLLFFYGVILCVGGLAAFGYLALLSNTMYEQWGATHANISVGILSAIIDNIPVMFAVLTMKPIMSQGQWLLVTLTAGIGGSMLSIGSAAGVALMGQSKGRYTFMMHLKWCWVIFLGYAAAIATHLWLNAALFTTTQ